MSSAPSPASRGKAGSPRADAKTVSPPTIRPGRPSDLDDLVELESRCFLPEDQFPRRSWRRLLTKGVADRSAIVLVIEGVGLAAAIIGLVRRGSQVMRIYSVAVDPSCRGMGLGGRLMRALAERGRRRGQREVSLEVREDNAAARGLYEKQGFRVVARLPRYYAGTDPGVRMRAPVDSLLRAR